MDNPTPELDATTESDTTDGNAASNTTDADNVTTDADAGDANEVLFDAYDAKEAAKAAEKEAKAANKALLKVEKEAAKAAEKEAKAAEKEAKRQPEQNGVRRPGNGTLCGAAWDLFDKKVATTGYPFAIAPVLEEARLQELNEANVRTEYARWKKFHGHAGRAAPTVTEAAVTEAAVTEAAVTV